MRDIAAKILDPTYLELTEPIALRSGARVTVTASEDRGPTITVTAESEPTPGPPRLAHRQREHAWRRTHGDVLRGLVGQWVVPEGEEIIGHGDDPAELVTRARDRGIRRPCVFHVEPPRPTTIGCLGSYVTHTMKSTC